METRLRFLFAAAAFAATAEDFWPWAVLARWHPMFRLAHSTALAQAVSECTVVTPHWVLWPTSGVASLVPYVGVALCVLALVASLWCGTTPVPAPALRWAATAAALYGVGAVALMAFAPWYSVELDGVAGVLGQFVVRHLWIALFFFPALLLRLRLNEMARPAAWYGGASAAVLAVAAAVQS